IDYLDRYPSILERLDADAVQTDFEEFLNPNNLCLAIAGPIGGSMPKLPKEILEQMANLSKNR
ncbi:MAG: hypothetical protein ACREBS_00755, partial [Nitrososphaerales archaeon]